MSNQEPKQAPDETSPKSLYPTYDSLKQVETEAEANLPIINRNDLMAYFGKYHNALVKLIKKNGKASS